MAVELPSTADIRKARHDAAKTAAERAEAARTPLLAVLGAGDLAVSAVSKAVAAARTRAAAQAEDVQHRVAELPQHLNVEELRKAVADLRAQAEHAYAEWAQQGEKTWDRIRKQPQVKDALERIETYTEKLDAQVDDIVDDARDATEKALSAVSTQTRSTGERLAKATQRFTGRAEETVTEVSKEASETIREAGTEVAHEARSTTRRAADRTAPKAQPASGTSKPAARRNSSANGTKSSS